MTNTGATTVIMVVMVDGVIMMDGVVEGAAVDGGRVPLSAFTLDRLTPPTDTMRILLHMGIMDTLPTGTTTDTRTEEGEVGHLSTPQIPTPAKAALSATNIIAGLPCGGQCSSLVLSFDLGKRMAIRRRISHRFPTYVMPRLR
jgi:hypothetical protein